MVRLRVKFTAGKAIWPTPALDLCCGLRGGHWGQNFEKFALICFEDSCDVSDPEAMSFKECWGQGLHMSHEKNPGWLGYIGDYTIQLYDGDYNELL